MEQNEQRKYWVSKVTLRPKVTFSGDHQPSAQEISAMHHAAHENCFIANSVTSSVSVEDS
jgi:organic hydroperoxide reductase OsmC/OhrA